MERADLLEHGVHRLDMALRGRLRRVHHVEEEMASVTSSSVARNDATRCEGSFRMKPTVSVRRACVPCFAAKTRVVGSSVAKS